MLFEISYFEMFSVNANNDNNDNDDNNNSNTIELNRILLQVEYGPRAVSVSPRIQANHLILQLRK